MRVCTTIEWIERVRKVMESIDGYDLPEVDRRTIFRCLSSELAEALERRQDLWESERSHKKWSEDDLAVIAELEGKTVCSWHEERNALDGMVQRLQRSPKSIKKKAIALGYTKAVDYWLNREAT